MRIGILGPAFANTGYGVQIGYLSRVLQGMGHDVALFAFNLRSGAMDMDGVPVYPRLFDEMGRDMAAHARHFGADVVIPVMDVWTLDIDAWEGVKLMPWFPVDHWPVSPGIVENARRAFQPIVYSTFGQGELERAGVKAAYIPCMVDTDVYRPIDRHEARAALGLPQDRYIVGMVAANVGTPSRKAFAQQMKAFKGFQAEHPKSVLYLHTFANGGGETDGENLIQMAWRMGLEPGKDVLFPDQYQYLLGYPPAAMAALYSSFNVLLSVSTGEGFCVPLVEAQACGTPVITGSWTAMP
jgi:glycosyltransferase involved in cell wall biosynthesis